MPGILRVRLCRCGVSAPVFLGFGPCFGKQLDLRLIWDSGTQPVACTLQQIKSLNSSHARLEQLPDVRVRKQITRLGY